MFRAYKLALAIQTIGHCEEPATKQSYQKYLGLQYKVPINEIATPFGLAMTIKVSKKRMKVFSEML
jgi:hypothetical protein